jgi:tryptophan-rich sensory protein
VVAGVGAWRAAPDARQRTQLLALFALNGALNVLWSLLFFHLQRPDWALAQIGFLWLSILWLMAVPGRYYPRIRLLLLPYLAWVSFASVLNAAVMRLNGPFG